LDTAIDEAFSADGQLVLDLAAVAFPDSTGLPAFAASSLLTNAAAASP